MAFSCLSEAFASCGTSLRTWEMQLVKSGGSLATTSGAPGLLWVWPLAAMYIQWLNARVVTALPETFATEPLGTPELPQPAITTASEKKAPSAKSHRLKFMDAADGSGLWPRNPPLSGNYQPPPNASSTSAARNTVGKRLCGSSGTRIESCERPDS